MVSKRAIAQLVGQYGAVEDIFVTNSGLKAFVRLETSAGAAKAHSWVRVPANYYDEPLAFRAACVKASSVEHMCKTICMENTKCTNEDCADPINSRFYLVVVQYTARLSQQKLEKYLHAMNNAPLNDARKIGKSKFHMRLAKPEDAARLTGYAHGAVAPFATATAIPTLVSHAVAALRHDE